MPRRTPARRSAERSMVDVRLGLDRREAWSRARDVAVWLTLLRDHLKREEPGHLLSADQKAFADGRKRLRDACPEVGFSGSCR